MIIYSNDFQKEYLLQNTLTFINIIKNLSYDDFVKLWFELHYVISCVDYLVPLLLHMCGYRKYPCLSQGWFLVWTLSLPGISSFAPYRKVNKKLV